jgi:hypothetical protein
MLRKRWDHALKASPVLIVLVCALVATGLIRRSSCSSYPVSTLAGWPTPTPSPSTSPTPSPSPGPGGFIGPAATCNLYVSPIGQANNPGTYAQPLTFDKAIGDPDAGTSPAHPGWTICLKGKDGKYLGGHTALVNGMATAPITIRSAPSEWAVLDQPNGIGGDSSVGGTASDYGDDPLWVAGNYVTVRDFEIMISNPNRRACRRMGLALIGIGTKAINLVIHDAGVGLFASEGQQGGEIYGNVFYNNGWIASTASKCTSGDGVVGPTGYGIYAQNTLNVKVVEDNIFTHNYNFGIHGYSSDGTKAKGFSVNRNAFVANGDQPAGFAGNNIFFGGKVSSFTFSSNYNYKGGNNFGGNNSQDGSFSNNLWNAAPIEMHGWLLMTFTGNKVYGGNNYGFVSILSTDLVNKANYNWNNNQYFNTQAYNQPFGISGINTMPLATWRSNTGFDSSTLTENGDIPQHRPTGLDYVVYPNKYQQGRANIFVANWDRLDTVSINLQNSGLTNGQAYEIRDTQNFLGTPILTGVYNSTNPVITLPMTSTTIIAPFGDTAPTHTDKEFGAFVVLPR